MKKISKQLAQVRPFRVMELLAKARAMEAQGRSIIHMEVGEPDFATPGPIVDAGIKALREGRTHYTPACGLWELRQAISQYYRDNYHCEVDAGRILITPGASGALQLILSLILEPGDEVLLTDPGYPCNRNFVLMQGARPILVPVSEATGYQPTVEMLRDHYTPGTALTMLASPLNPTGTLLELERLKEIWSFLDSQDCHLLMDEIYQGLVYGEHCATALHVSDKIFVINSFSKYFGMTGWRIGWLVAAEEYIPKLDILAQNLFLAASTPAQHAALAAFDPLTLEITEQRRKEFQQRRDFLYQALQQIGFEIASFPQGAFYLYADCRRFSDDSDGFCETLLTKTGVAITPGTDFGHHQAGTHVRFAYTTSVDRLAQGVERLDRYLNSSEVISF